MQIFFVYPTAPIRVQSSPTQPKTGAKLQYKIFLCVVGKFCNSDPIPLPYQHFLQNCIVNALRPLGPRDIGLD